MPTGYFVRDHRVTHDVTTCEAMCSRSRASIVYRSTRAARTSPRAHTITHDMRLRTNPYTKSNTIAPITDAIQPAACPG